MNDPERCIVNVDDVEAYAFATGARYQAEVRPVGLKIGSKKLGFNVTTVPPGKFATPYHAHHVNEEMFLVLEGRGSIRLAEGTHPIRAGDFVCVRAGRDSGHQIHNDSDAPLRYLAVSTMLDPEVVEYPDSGKIGVMSGTAPGRIPGPDAVIRFWRGDDSVDYLDGEPK